MARTKLTARRPAYRVDPRKSLGKRAVRKTPPKEVIEILDSETTEDESNNKEPDEKPQKDEKCKKDENKEKNEKNEKNDTNTKDEKSQKDALHRQIETNNSKIEEEVKKIIMSLNQTKYGKYIPNLNEIVDHLLGEPSEKTFEQSPGKSPEATEEYPVEAPTKTSLKADEEPEFLFGNGNISLWNDQLLKQNPEIPGIWNLMQRKDGNYLVFKTKTREIAINTKITPSLMLEIDSYNVTFEILQNNETLYYTLGFDSPEDLIEFKNAYEKLTK
ncbi:hypothetical protein TRFO_17789 [Tritrichomonas foetus]|uniref:PH domain-containing protein n=1 Tax=Tritrichomonas foetus TaxID=1144522 RepID=A0A1J4KMS1_9EUKA|nr:hypothetical protein TRFO_17789 [Tritrichomonas foetus]|eukprot:OHT12410.1 hypothetical protein TRFO_17789 [Tritrichomonas foetus]